MDNIFYTGQALWAQMDPNMHLRHSAYADFCTQARSNLLDKVGLSLKELSRQKIGPILFREELTYYKEIALNETVRVAVEMTKFDFSNSRFSFRHTIYKQNDTIAAVVMIDGAWMDLVKRKLTVIPQAWMAIVDKLPKSADYTAIPAEGNCENT